MIRARLQDGRISKAARTTATATAMACCAATLLSQTLTGCGQKGGLYLPEKAATVVPTPADATDGDAGRPSASGTAPSNQTDSEKKKVAPGANQ
jgi:predicted small lipoprotein YifL